ncbi:MAG: tripartite tricarboxylate transporter TctB family protein [Hyphomicrobiales bacterium]|nr:MAG: tripartite tricarboxylate transporter TctB family protein [Hyphomicrobiales bacterium]
MASRIPGIRNSADVVAGSLLVIISVVAFFMAQDLPEMVDYRFTAGTMPRLAALLVGVFGLAIAVLGFLRDGDGEGQGYPIYALRGPLMIAAAVVLFALTVKPLGMLAACFILFVLTSMARSKPKWFEVFIAAAVMSIGCVAVFVYFLKLPYPVLPGGF